MAWCRRNSRRASPEKVVPVHHFWHTFDIAYTRFSDHHIDQPAEVDAVTREAYSREVISFGSRVTTVRPANGPPVTARSTGTAAEERVDPVVDLLLGDRRGTSDAASCGL